MSIQSINSNIELLLRIFSFLDSHDLQKVSNVCKLFKVCVETLRNRAQNNSLKERTISKPSIHLKLIKAIGGREKLETLPLIRLDENNSFVTSTLMGKNSLVRGIDLFGNNFLAAKFFHTGQTVIQLFFKNQSQSDNNTSDLWCLKSRISNKEQLLQTADFNQKDLHIVMSGKMLIIDRPLPPKIQKIFKDQNAHCEKKYEMQLQHAQGDHYQLKLPFINSTQVSYFYSVDCFNKQFVGLTDFFVMQLFHEEKFSPPKQWLWTLGTKWLGENWTYETFDINSASVLMHLNSAIRMVNLKDYFHFKIIDAVGGIDKLSALPFIDLNLRPSQKVTKKTFGSHSTFIGLASNNYFIAVKYRTAIDAHTETIQLLFHSSEDPKNVWRSKVRVDNQDTLKKWDLAPDNVSLSFEGYTHFTYSTCACCSPHYNPNTAKGLGIPTFKPFQF